MGAGRLPPVMAAISEYSRPSPKLSRTAADRAERLEAALRDLVRAHEGHQNHIFGVGIVPEHPPGHRGTRVWCRATNSSKARPSPALALTTRSASVIREVEPRKGAKGHRKIWGYRAYDACRSASG